MTGDNPQFTTHARPIHENGEVQWGGDSEDSEAWSDAIATSANTTVTEDGTIKTGSDSPDNVVYDFETGDTSRWTAVNNLSAVTDKVYSGSYSAYIGSGQSGTHQAYVIPKDYQGGAQPTAFEYIWRETSSQNGAGIRLFNSNGDVEVGVATQNPQWAIDDGSDSFINVYNSGDYRDWTRFTLTFDWGNGTFNVDFEDLADGDTYTDTDRLLKNGVDVERIQIDSIDASTWQSGKVDCWFDNITLKK